jgi:hypothetical protein
MSSLQSPMDPWFWITFIALAFFTLLALVSFVCLCRIWRNNGDDEEEGDEEEQVNHHQITIETRKEGSGGGRIIQTLPLDSEEDSSSSSSNSNSRFFGVTTPLPAIIRVRQEQGVDSGGRASPDVSFMKSNSSCMSMLDEYDTDTDSTMTTISYGWLMGTTTSSSNPAKKTGTVRTTTTSLRCPKLDDTADLRLEEASVATPLPSLPTNLHVNVSGELKKQQRNQPALHYHYGRSGSPDPITTASSVATGTSAIVTTTTDDSTIVRNMKAALAALRGEASLEAEEL